MQGQSLNQEIGTISQFLSNDISTLLTDLQETLNGKKMVAVAAKK